MGKQIKLKKGFDIKIPGAAQKQIGQLQPSKVFSIKPSDFRNFSYKLSVAEGDEVLAGQSIIFDKERPEIFIPSPVSGEVVEIVRAEKRRNFGAVGYQWCRQNHDAAHADGLYHSYRGVCAIGWAEHHRRARNAAHAHRLFA